jgi:hypothetical protein
MVSINKMRITPWHPVKINGEWKFPSDLAETDEVSIDFVYNLVLDS